MLLPAKLTDTVQTHLEQLVTTGATEGQHLDFKRELPTIWNDSAKVKFLADITAFANAGGGDIVYGVDQDRDAKAIAVVPQVLAGIDAEVRRLQDFMLNLVEPRLSGVQIQPIQVIVDGVTGHALVIRVPPSWAGPHRSKANFHFYVRDGLRNRQLEIPEIRAMFIRSDSQFQRMRDFRIERLAKVVIGQTPILLSTGPKIVVHVFATQTTLGQAYIDPVSYSRNQRRLPAIGNMPASPVTLNFDGAFGPIVASGRKPGYTQQFRQGYFEAVWELTPSDNVQKPVLPGGAYENYLNNFLTSVRAEFVAHDLAQGMVVFVSLVGADQVVFVGPSEMGLGWGHSEKQFDRKDILLPDALIEAEVTIGRGMRSTYDLMCQAAGYEGSKNYGEDGEWKVQE
jgi:hypothetical protein